MACTLGDRYTHEALLIRDQKAKLSGFERDVQDPQLQPITDAAQIHRQPPSLGNHVRKFLNYKSALHLIRTCIQILGSSQAHPPVSLLLVKHTASLRHALEIMTGCPSCVCLLNTIG